MVTFGFSVDVEDPSDATLLGGTARPSARGPMAATELILQLMERFGRRGTFFVLGTVAERFPDLVRRIAADGHEVACHGDRHDLLTQRSPKEFCEAMAGARGRLQDLSGQAVGGYRAPTFSLGRKVPWVVDALVELGFSYDSSLFPVRTPLYGEAAPTGPYRLVGESGWLVELPPACARVGRLLVPVAGGIWWRWLPVAAVLSLLGRTDDPAVLYVHPWELDPKFRPPQGASMLGRLSMTLGRPRLGHVLQRIVATQALATLGELAGELDAPSLSAWRLGPGGLTPVTGRAGESRTR